MKVKATGADLDCFRRLLWLNPGRDLRKSDNPQVYEKTSVLKSFREVNAQLPLSSVIETQGLILVLLSRFLSNELYQSGKDSPIPSAILESMNYILTHLAGAITVEQLAGHAHLSTDYFSKSFYRHTGLRPLQYIHQKRVERAQFLILTTHLSFSAIATETGFESLSYFTRVFKAITRQAPGAYRKIHLHVM
jgi:AraC family transcriptional regulator